MGGKKEISIFPSLFWIRYEETVKEKSTTSLKKLEKNTADSCNQRRFYKPSVIALQFILNSATKHKATTTKANNSKIQRIFSAGAIFFKFEIIQFMVYIVIV